MEALSYPCPPVKRLLAMAPTWADAPAANSGDLIQPRYQPRQKPGLAVYIGEAEVQRLITSFRAGVRKQDLARRYGYSVSSVERLLRERGVRKWTVVARDGSRRSSASGIRQEAGIQAATWG